MEISSWYPMSPDKGPPLPVFLGVYWPWYEVPASGFTISGLAVSPSSVAVGETVTVSCTVTNSGSEIKTGMVTLSGDFSDQQTVTLQPGESKEVSFHVTPAVAGNYNVSVEGQSGTFTATAAPSAADIRLENLTIAPGTVAVGGTVTITVTARNYGSAAGTKKITCTVN
ncbi:MAG: CARDB domain-containing protein [Dehalococcoidales bacterium]|nr:CARDB domain-containing protein [Dehalococcoidales bacterium]